MAKKRKGRWTIARRVVQIVVAILFFVPLSAAGWSALGLGFSSPEEPLATPSGFAWWGSLSSSHLFGLDLLDPFAALQVAAAAKSVAFAGLACRSQLVAHLPRHTVFCTVIVRRRVAGGLACGALLVGKGVAVICRQQVAPIGIAIGIGMGAGGVLGCQNIPSGIVGVARDGFIILRDLRQLLQLVIGILPRILCRDAGRIGRNAACAVVGIIVIGPGQALAPVGGIL